MYSKTMSTYQNAFDVVRRYRLDRVDFEGGSTEGFAAWLFERGAPMGDIKAVAKAISRYKAEFAKRTSLGARPDAEDIYYATELAEGFEHRTQVRLDLAKYIRSVQWGSNGGAVWAAVAELATTPQGKRHALIRNWSAPVAEGVRHAIGGLQKFEGYLGETFCFDYEAGAHKTLDLLLRLDIERFEATLEEAPPWNGVEDERSVEKAALYGLVSANPFGSPCGDGSHGAPATALA